MTIQHHRGGSITTTLVVWLTLLSTTTMVHALTKSTSLDEPFQSAFKNLQHSGCVTLYNRNGRAGCGTEDREHEAGPLYYYNYNPNDDDDGSQSSSSSSSLPNDGTVFVAVIEDYQLSAQVVSNIVSVGSTYCKGILVLNSTNVENHTHSVTVICA